MDVILRALGSQNSHYFTKESLQKEPKEKVKLTVKLCRMQRLMFEVVLQMQ